MIDRYFLPELSKLDQKDGEITLFHTVSNRVGASVSVPMCDLEAINADEELGRFETILKKLPIGVLARFKLDVYQDDEGFRDRSLSRSESIHEIGGVKKRLTLSFEAKESLIDTIRSFSKTALQEPQGHPLTRDQTRAQFLTGVAPYEGNASLDLGKQVVGVIRLKNFSQTQIDKNTLAQIQDLIPEPYSISVTVSRGDQARSEVLLRGKLNRDQFSNDLTGGEKSQATADAIREIALHGESIFDMEWLLTLPRRDERTLRSDLESAFNAVSKIGSAYIETHGVRPSYYSSCPGSRPGPTLSELGLITLYYLPISTFGERDLKGYAQKTTCLLHRRDGSIMGFDPFSKKNSSFNTLITGKTGSGKSVFGNTLSRALLNDESIHMIKVDVGGSYKRECEEYQGREISFHLNRKSEVDPFQEVALPPTKESVSVLTTFISSLIRENGEEFIQKSLIAGIENEIEAYLGSIRDKHSLHGFIEFSQNHPRREILQRFGRGGIYENAVTESLTPIHNRYTYYNFDNILGAANEDYAGAVMSAVIAVVNLKMLKLSTGDSRVRGQRLVFFCDETKFFLDRNSDFFLLTTANFRKFGHAVILAGQNIEDFILTKRGESDRGLILNSPNRIYFKAQCDRKILLDDLSMSKEAVDFITEQGLSQNAFREFILQNDEGLKRVRLYLTRDEYWRMTSSRRDLDKMDEIKANLPWLTNTQVIQIMTLQEASQ